MVDQPKSEIQPLYTEVEAARLLGIKPRSLRTERCAGRISYKPVAGKIMYRHGDLIAWQNEGISSCLAQTPARGSSSSETRDGPAPSSISVGRSKGRNASGQRLSMPPILGALRNTSRTGSTSAAEPREPAHVIPIKSGSPTS